MKKLEPIGTVQVHIDSTFMRTYRVCVNHYRGREHWIQATGKEEAERASKELTRKKKTAKKFA